MATSARAGARRGPVGAKKSEGGYASSSPSYIQVEPPPPLSPVLLCEFALLLCKNPLHMTMFVLCYGQPAQPQPLARAGQTAGVGMVRLWVGGPRLTGRNVLRSVCRAGRARARGRCLCAVGRNAFTSCTNYFPSPSLRTHSAHFAPHICAPHTLRSTSHSRASRASAEPHSHPGTSLFFAHPHFFVAIVSCTAMFAPV
jgi:hypothetical protein